MHAWGVLGRRFGEPRTVAGLPVRFAILGLGKLGGAALGYASDIELLFVYSDSGTTAGPERIENAEFFDRLVREVLQLVHAKREGIFHIDLRLRPYGAAGPLGCSLESFCTYYEAGGPRIPTRGCPSYACARWAETAPSRARSNGCATRWSIRRRASTLRSCVSCERGRSRRRPHRGA